MDEGARVTYDAIDCQGFAGGFTLGTVKAGFRLVGKREMKGGFGVESCETNRHLLGYDWKSEVCDHEEWTPYSVPYVFGNPPCSGFSLLSSQDFRGIDSPINSCMWAFAGFAARCHPEVAVFESVQPAYKQGRPLMQALRDHVEQLTGQRYDLIHVLHNAGKVGGCAVRRRYFFVISKIPFGVEDPGGQPVNMNDVVSDLLGLGNTWEKQPYRHPPTHRWAKLHHSADGVVDGHYSKEVPAARRALDLVAKVGWAQGENLSMVVQRCYESHGKLPESWAQDKVDKLVGNGFKMGFYQLHRWRGDAPARVVTGGAHLLVMHPTEDRLLTLREVARVQGFPDDWNIAPIIRSMGAGKVGPLYGKGIAVEAGQWISGQVKAALDGQPGTIVGTEIGERERLVDLT
jgi:site-specific DNA-cytosine methylase